MVALALGSTLATLMPERRASGFGALPVLDGGRVKPLDTVARASLLMFSGKQTARAGEKRLGPSEWLLDVVGAPEKADAYKVFMVNDLDVLSLAGKTQQDGRYYSFADLAPARDEIERQAAAAEKLEPQARDRFQTAVFNLDRRLTLYQRLKNTLQAEDTKDMPRELAGYVAALAPGARAAAAHAKGRAFDAKDLQLLTAFFERYAFLARAAAFRPLAPLRGEGDAGWKTVGESLLTALKAETPHPGIATYALLLQAHARGDAPAFAAALAEYRAWLDRELPRTAARARWEVVFNRAEPFYQGILLYLTALLLCFASWLFWAEPLRVSAYKLLLFAFGVHTAGLAARIILQGRPPVTNLYSSAVFVGWFSVLLGLLVERLSKRGFGSAVAAAVGASTLIIAHNLTGSGDTMEMMRAVLDSNFWLSTHVVTVTMGYSAAFLAGTLAALYILRGLLTPSLDKETGRQLVKAAYGVVCFSLFFSFVGTVLGGIWADQSWGRFWGWDPKENGALLIVLWNAVILHSRWGGFIRERGLMVMAVFGNIVTSLSWFGVNMLGIGLHSYGFMDKAFWWLAAFVASQLVVMALGALPGRLWRSREVAPA